jgi:hypothetical protein
MGDAVTHPDEKSLIEGLSRIPVVKDAANATHESMQKEKMKDRSQKSEYKSQKIECRRE